MHDRRNVLSGHFEVVKWLYANRPESRTIAGIVKGVQCGHLRIAHWLSKKFPEYTLSRYAVDKQLISPYGEKSLEMLQFLQVTYPSIFTTDFLQELRRDFSDPYPKKKKSADALLRWLDENYPSGPQEA